MLNKKRRFTDIGDDLTEEDERILDEVRASMPKMSPDEEKAYLKELVKDLEASEHPIRLI